MLLISSLICCGKYPKYNTGISWEPQPHLSTMAEADRSYWTEPPRVEQPRSEMLILLTPRQLNDAMKVNDTPKQHTSRHRMPHNPLQRGHFTSVELCCCHGIDLGASYAQYCSTNQITVSLLIRTNERAPLYLMYVRYRDPARQKVWPRLTSTGTGHPRDMCYSLKLSD